MHRTDAELGTGLGQGDTDLTLKIIEKLADLVHRLARDDDRRHRRRACGQPLACQRQPVAVGGNGAQIALLRLVEIDSVQVVAGLLGRDGEPCRVDHVARIGRRQHEGVLHVADADRRKILDRQRRQPEIGAAGTDARMAVSDRDVNLGALGKLADDVIEKMGGHRGRPCRADRAFDLRGDVHVHVGRRHGQLAVGRLQNDVGQDRDRIAAFDDRLNLAERPQQADTIDGELHWLSLLSGPDSEGFCVAL